MVGVLMSAGVNALDFTSFVEWITSVWFLLSVYAEQVVRFVLAWGKELFGIFGGAAGILKWWYHREAVLHKRLETYLDREDARLKNARRDVLYTLARPGERRKFAEPMFAVGPLRKILRRRQLDSRWSWGLPESSADRVLTDALKQISRRSEVLEKAQQNYREQAVTAHILKGVVAAMRAQRSPSKESAYRTEALHAFQTALVIPGQDHRLFVMEQMANQLRCLGMLDEAAEAYSNLIAEIEVQLAGKPRDLARARALKWRALVYQAIRWHDATPGKGALRAWGGVQGPGVKTALDEHLKPRAPLTEWDAIEHGDVGYVAAFVAHNLGFTDKEGECLSDAVAAYAKAQVSARRPLWRLRGKEKMLAIAARAGIKRVEDAQAGNYDLAWLLPPAAQTAQPAAPSNVPQNPTQPIGGSGGQDGVPQTP